MKKHYLIAYDIACNKRLKKVFKFLSEEGFALQYSLFIVHDYSYECKAIMQTCQELIDENEDALICVTLHTQSPVIKLGKKTCDGIFIAHEDPYLNDLLT